MEGKVTPEGDTRMRPKTAELLDWRTVERSAVLSEDGHYRYRLERWWCRDDSRLVYCMLNPSIADADRDDPTVRKCCGFAVRHGYGGIVIVNLFAYRATNPADLKIAIEAGYSVHGPLNMNYLRAAFVARPVVLAWGHNGASIAPAHCAAIVTMAKVEAEQVLVLKWLASGVPAHPLTLHYSNRLTAYP